MSFIAMEMKTSRLLMKFKAILPQPIKKAAKAA
jgi:hypothetical protein